MDIVAVHTVSSATSSGGWSVGIALQHASATTHGLFSTFIYLFIL